MQYLYKELLANFYEVEEESKEFHYAQLLLLIVLVAWRLPEDIKFPPYDEDLVEAAQFASLWETKDPERIMESKFFWILVNMDLYTVIS